KTRAQARAKIDEIDTHILALLAERMKMARDVGLVKAAAARSSGKKTTAVLAPEREEEIFRRLHRLVDAQRMPWPLVQAVYSEIISLCRAAQGQVTAYVLGPAGTHSEFAARARFGEALSIQHHDSIPAAIKAAEQAAAGGDANAVAVVPIENSLEGTVAATVDTLLGTSLRITGEGYYRVRHALLSRARAPKEIKTIYSHPMGLAQCQRWLQENLPHVKLIEVSSTAEAARHVASTGASRSIAAIASPYLAVNGLNALASDIQDSLDNTTRFGVLGAQIPGPSGDDKTSLVFSLPNKSGSLFEAIQVFSKAKLNMTKIESRPHRGLQWEYLFYVDIDGHAYDSKVTRALEAFDKKVRYFKILGTYPKGRPWN
ncbi:MAG: prephenate dehydratase, partial [Deltaproteobacteria bacterium]|nr:prephenate dehydratase [Deltaproteobacteria bacterium]